MASIDIKTSDGETRFFIPVIGDRIFFDIAYGGLVDFGIPEITVSDGTKLRPAEGLEYNGSVVYTNSTLDGSLRLVKTRQAGWLFGNLSSVEPRFVYSLETGLVSGVDNVYKGSAIPGYGETVTFSRYLYQGGGSAPTVTLERKRRRYEKSNRSALVISPYDYMAGVYISDHDDSKVVIGDPGFSLNKKIRPHFEDPDYDSVIVHDGRYYLAVAANVGYFGDILPTGIYVHASPSEPATFDGPLKLIDEHGFNYKNIYFKLRKVSDVKYVLTVREVPVETVLKLTDPGFGSLKGTYVKNKESTRFVKKNAQSNERIERMSVSGEYYRWFLSDAQAGVYDISQGANNIFIVKPSPLSGFGDDDKIEYTKVEFVLSAMKSPYYSRLKNGYLRYAKDDRFQRIVFRSDGPEDYEDVSNQDISEYDSLFTLALSDVEGYYVAQGLSWV